MLHTAESATAICENIDKPSLAQNYMLVHAEGICNVSETLIDSKTNVTANDCYMMRKVVEMHQWVETKHEEKINDNETKVTYTYQTAWKEQL